MLFGKRGKILGRDGYVGVRMERNPLGLFIIAARINHLPARLVLDTGAAQTILARSEAERFCSLVPTDATASGVERAAQSYETGVIDRLTLGRVALLHVNFIAVELSHVNDAIAAQGGERIDGLLGADLLNRRNAVIDYADAMLYVETRGTALRRVRKRK